MGLFSSIKKAATKVQNTVKSTALKATAKTPLAATVKTLTQTSIKNPASLVKSATIIGKAYVAVQSGGISVLATKAASSALKAASKTTSLSGAVNAAQKAATGVVAKAIQPAKVSVAIKATPIAATPAYVAKRDDKSSLVKASAPAAKSKATMTREEWRIYAAQRETVGGLL